MIRLFDIKRRVKQLKNSDKELFDNYIDISTKDKNDLLKLYETDENGLSTKQADERLEKNGQNVVVKREKKSAFSFFVKSFNDKFIYILILLAVIDFLLADKLGAFIILGIAFVSAMIKFVQEYSTYKFNQKLEQNIFNTTTVLRNKKAKEIRIENVVVGDIIELNAGSIIPADVMLIESKDLFLNQSVFTGESVLVEKTIVTNDAKEIFGVTDANIGDISIDTIFPIKSFLKSSVVTTTSSDGKVYVNIPIAYYGGGANLSKVTFDTEDLKYDSCKLTVVDLLDKYLSLKGIDPSNVDLDKLDLAVIKNVMLKCVTIVTGYEPFKFISVNKQGYLFDEGPRAPQALELIKNAQGE